jgi:uridine nucleosidase
MAPWPADVAADDAMAILCAFNSPLVEVIGITTTYGNVPTKLATKNALRLLEVAGMTQVHIAVSTCWLWDTVPGTDARAQVPVAEGSAVSLNGTEKVRIADFVHGKDGFGNSFLPEPKVRARALPCVDHEPSTLLSPQSRPIADLLRLPFHWPWPRPWQGEACGKSAAQFIVDTVNANPGEVSILALAALTNLAHAIQLDPSITSKWVSSL